MVQELRRPGLRADARRNVERIVAAAEAEVARYGADASLEEIARRAGVGSATLHRHFPTRRALLEAVFKDRVSALCTRATERLTDPDPGQALVDWLRDMGRHAAANRGMSAALVADSDSTADSPVGAGSHQQIIAAGDALLTRARQAGAVRSGIETSDLLKLVGAISQATEHEPDGTAETDRLLSIVIDGMRQH